MLHTKLPVSLNAINVFWFGVASLCSTIKGVPDVDDIVTEPVTCTEPETVTPLSAIISICLTEP